ncbi:ABC transporter type 1, transmembrane domain-containing protein [Spinellus fusiger]|nr:ABC transporter type 1, transmembrane domain-containing protein [Spinellus fusiger]
MTLELSFCRCMLPPEHGMSLVLESCTREFLLDAILPSVFLIVSLVIHATRTYRAWKTSGLQPRHDMDTIRIPTTQHTVLLRQSLMLLVLVLLEISCWAFLFAWRLESAILDSETSKDIIPWTSRLKECGVFPYHVLSPGLALIPRKIYILILVIKSFTTPSDPVSPSKFTLYNPHFLVFYSFALISASLRLIAHFGSLLEKAALFTAGIEKEFSVIDFAICLTLWYVSATTPSELNHGELLDMDEDEDGVLVLDDGHIVRNGRLLSFEANASPLSFVTFSWINSLLQKAYHQPLTADQLWALPLRQRAQENFRRFQQTVNASLAKRIFSANKTTVIIQWVTAFTVVGFHYAKPFFLLQLLSYLQNDKEQPSNIGYVYCFAIFICSVISTLVASQTLLWGRRWHVSVTNMLNSEIYKHTLLLHYSKSPLTSEGDPVNDEEDPMSNKLSSLMTRDTERLAELVSYLNVSHAMEVSKIGVGVVFLYHLLGNALLAGLVVMVFALPSTHYISQRLMQVQKQLEEAKSWRTRLLKELLEGIKTIKFLAWEHKWENVIAIARDEELVKLIKLYTQNTLLGLIWYATPVFVTTLSFAWYTLVEHKVLDSSTAFVSIVLFGMLRDPLNVLSQAFIAYKDANLSLRHIATFLSSGEKQPTSTHSHYETTHYSSTEHLHTGFNAGLFQWHPMTEASTFYAPDKTVHPLSYDSPSLFCLSVPDLVFPVGSVSMITGHQKSGKSSLLCALLGEMHCVSGHSFLPSRFLTPRTHTLRDQKHKDLYMFRVAYVAQVPWIERGTIRENILFSEPWDDTRYRSVLYQCDLLKDLSLLENGDLTQVGEHGALLSESQKHKISFARAIYSRAKTVLIDDIFACLDTAIAHSLYKKCIQGELMQGRTVIITATEIGPWASHLQFLVELEHGKVIYTEKDSNAIIAWIHAHQTRQDNSVITDNEDHIDALFETDSLCLDEDFFDEASILREASLAAEEPVFLENTSRKYAYATYFSACGGWQFWAAAISFTAMARLTSISESYWLKEETSPSTPSPNDSHLSRYVAIYLCLSLITVVFSFIRTVVQYRGSLRASNRLFLRLLQVVCHAPLDFFDITLPNDIMSRFGKDMETVDSSIGWHVNFLFQTLFGVLGVIFTIGSILPEAYLVSIIAAILYIYIGRIYMRASGELKKLNANSRPAIVHLYTDTLAGLLTIRAYGEQRSMMRKMFQRLDENMRPFYTLWTTNRWLFVRVEVLGALVSLTVSILLVYQRSTVDAGSAGMALVFSTSLLEYAYWFMRQLTTVETHFEAVERINEYLDMPQEPPGVVEGSRPPAAWPASATILVRDLMVSFGGEEEAVLRNVSFNVLSGEKIALVGRARGEKDVLISCLFRFMNPLRGSIKIDGVNIAWIGVKDLRSRITYIAKEGWLLSRTVRTNLDPFGEYDDYELWQVLYRVHLAYPSSEEGSMHESVSRSGPVSVVYDLDMDVGKDGLLLTVGDRQLLCIARALLRDCTRLVILEEALLTPETQEKMQRVIEEEFEESTLLVIPYSLESVMRYDRVMLFDQASLVEYDPPFELLQKEQGLLHSLFKRAKLLDTYLAELTDPTDPTEAPRDSDSTLHD